jgi:hypothetical protein
MKTLLVSLSLLISVFTFSQDEVFTEEWYQKLDSDLEYIIFPNPSKGDLNIRIYRGKSENHSVKITNTLGQVVHTSSIKREDYLDIDFLGKGIYFVTISNDKKNLTQILEIR